VHGRDHANATRPRVYLAVDQERRLVENTANLGGALVASADATDVGSNARGVVANALTHDGICVFGVDLASTDCARDVAKPLVFRMFGGSGHGHVPFTA